MPTELIGIIRVRHRDPTFRGKQFLGVTLECSDGKAWIVDYREQSPFHEFADRQVQVAGDPYQPEPDSQRLIENSALGHFRVESIRLISDE
jgi:hypothetical protein